MEVNLLWHCLEKRKGKDKVVTPIIKDKTTPSCAPFANNASAMGIVPKMSAYYT